MDSLGAYTMQSQLTGSDESTFLYHTSCPSCGSSDGNSVYSDGHTYCFVCNHFDSGQPSDDCERPQKPIMLQGTPTKLRKRGLSEETCRKYRIHKDGDTYACTILTKRSNMCCKNQNKGQRLLDGG